MTATITLSCPQGIVLATDRKITYTDPDGNVVDYEPQLVDKIYRFSKVGAGASCWGLYWGHNFGSSTILEILKEFENTMVENKDDVNIISEKLKSYLQARFPEIKKQVGIHLAGYCRGSGDDLYPQLRHVFHETWNNPGEFVNENSNQEYHLENGTKRVYPYTPFISLFNGDNTVANMFFNFLPTVYPKRERQIILDLMNLDECIQLAKLIIRTSSDILGFLTEIDKKIEKPEVKGLMVAKITKQDGFQWVE